MNETDEHSQYQENGYEEDLEKINALNLNWTMGMNYSIVNGAHNLTTENKKEIFYVAGHTGIIFDFENNTQRLLQGHCNKITCTAVCPAEDIIITADAGQDSMLVVWDARTGIPRKTIFDPHPNGVECLDISRDGNHIVSISKEDKSNERQEVTVWDWKSPNKSRLISHPVHEKAKDYIKYVNFNPDRPQEFATTGKKRVLFWTWEQGAQGYEFYGPSYSDRKADFTQTVFIPGNSQAVTGTTDGHIVVWDISLIMEDYSQPEERRKIKVVNLMNTGNKSETASKKPIPAINILKIQGKYLVVGSSNGSVRFYDFQYTIVAWFEEIGIGNITSISFSRESKYSDPYGGKSMDDDGSKDFDSPDFIIVDTECTVHMLRANQFDQIEDEKKKPHTLMKLLKSPIRCMAVRPHSYTLAISCKNGNLYEWNFYDKKAILKPFKVWEEKHIPTCIEFSPDGRFLAVANANGVINFFDYEKGDWQPFSQSLQVSLSQDITPKVEMISFAPDSKHLAVADNLFYVSLFRIDHKFGDVEQPKEWQFVLKNRAHLGKIRSLAFGESLTETGEVKLRLFSIGDDKKLVEYDIYASQGKSDNERLAVVSVFPIEQETNPCACIWYPVDQFKEDILLTVNEEYKIKLWNANNVEQKITKKTCLGPTYGGPINKFLVIRGNDSNDAYLAYSTAEKIVGLIKLPIDGNPNNSMGLIAHPEAITGLGASSDGKYLFTSGGDDYSINQWIIDLSVIDQNALLQNHDDIFPDLLEGGRDGQTYRDLKDFFYYSQIRSKKENTTKARKLEGTVPLDEIPNLMRALGYYPTQKEIENMQNEIRYSEFLTEGRRLEECNLKTFVALFVNHRPVYGIGKKNIEDALNIVTDRKDKDKEAIKGVLASEEFLQILKTRGEKMTDQELEYCFNILCGEGGIDTFPEIDAETLAKDLLGFEELNEEPEQTENYENY